VPFFDVVFPAGFHSGPFEPFFFFIDHSHNEQYEQKTCDCQTVMTVIDSESKVQIRKAYVLYIILAVCVDRCSMHDAVCSLFITS
jgi:hypothetical protein